MEENKIIHNNKLVKVIFTPVINYRSIGCDYNYPHGFVYFLSQYHEKCLNRQGEELRNDKFKKIFGYRYAGIDCENKDGEIQEGLLIQPQGHITHFADRHREEESSLLLPNDEQLFYFDNPVIPDYIQIGISANESIKQLEKRVEYVRQQEIEKFGKQGIETILLDSSQISDNFLVLLSKNGDFLPKAD